MLAQISDLLGLAGGIAVNRDFIMLLIVWTLALLLLFTFWLMTRSPWGRVLRAIREDEAAAFAVGKNVVAYKLQVLVLGECLGDWRDYC